MFIDRARIEVRSGDGGAGCVSFRREKFVPRGGPDGGDGGRGGAVILKADPARSTLNDFHHRQHFIAGNGRPGEGRQRTGRDGASMQVPVPPGTVVLDEDGRVVADLAVVGDTFVVATGGQGGSSGGPAVECDDNCHYVRSGATGRDDGHRQARRPYPCV